MDDPFYNSYDKNLYAITPSTSGASDTSLSLLQASSSNPASTSVSADQIESGVSVATTPQATGTVRQGKALFNNDVAGYILGFDPKDGNAKFYIGNTTSYFNWDGYTLTIAGNITATSGTIGGFTITSTTLYGGIIKTGANVGVGSNGVIMDTAGLRGYSASLGLVFNLPTDGSAPTFASGVINNTIFNVNTNAVIQTSTTVGDGSANSAGILINNTGLYGCAANQTLANANLKALIDGTISITGTITANAGAIGGFTIGADYVKDSADSFGLASTITGGDDIRFWAGATFANRVTAPYRVYESGRVYVGSLSRNDFQWTTLLESLDGIANARATLGCGSVVVTTNGSNLDFGYLIKQPDYPPIQLTWAKDRRIRTRLNISQTTNQNIWIITGADFGTARHIGFKILNNTLYGTVANGTTESTVSLGSYTNTHDLECYFTAGVQAEFFVDGTSVGTLSTNIPTSGLSYRIMEVYIQANETAAKTLTFSYWDFWQAN